MRKRYNVRLPEAKYKVWASSRKDAIDRGIELHKEEMARFIECGAVYTIPRICDEWTPRNPMEELANEVPIKPSRLRKDLKRMR